jgi:hypothetical protein
MKNLLPFESKLSEAPKKGGLKGKENQDWGYRGYNLNYNHVNGFLRSRVGQPWDKIISEYVHADWVPPMHRQASKLKEFVATDTFLENGQIKIRGPYSWYSRHDALS